MILKLIFKSPVKIRAKSSAMLVVLMSFIKAGSFEIVAIPIMSRFTYFMMLFNLRLKRNYCIGTVVTRRYFLIKTDPFDVNK